ncbi:2-isopropylmalate synthase/homocitrate synthase family protein [Pirellula staleyi DSM 6068]|uniref:Citramalate synthase n=1 Tax=Pirellula staleyi (strain ATCC 27377 / DSM 6068 / ICPB 4128) TaxID=530564 RepID=D2QX79_PIRSD|nr:2-isopropylmalate synthase/homocitrate synthase family protein [Pirellula staleyi DSM 6068]
MRAKVETQDMRTIQIYDTTLRDGTQGEGVSLSLEDKLQIAARLDEIGIDFIEGGYPLSNPKDAEFFQRVRAMKFKTAKVCAFGMTRRKGVIAADDPGMKALVESHAPICTIVGKTSDFHVTEVLRVTLEENLAMIHDSIAYLVSQGREVFYDAEHFFDGSAANSDYALKTITTAAKAGAKMVILCDTNGGTMPEQIAERTRWAREALEPLGVQVGIHCHNDCELAVANSLSAVDAGAAQVQGTINGVGERCGNADLISVMANLGLKKKGYSILGGRGLTHLTELSRFVYETANLNMRSGQPFVGQSAFAHKGGMHVHAITRATSSYEHLDPELVGNERRILVSELSGRSNIAALTAKHNVSDDRELMDRILKQVVDLEASGWQFEAAGASFDLLVRRATGNFNSHFDRLKYHVGVSAANQGEPVTEASVKLNIRGQERYEVAEGDGPVNALDAALRKALAVEYPTLRDVQLIDYKVRVVNGQQGTAARIRVIIESADQHDVWGTVGVSENIIEASWLALVDAIEYKLCKDGVA